MGDIQANTVAEFRMKVMRQKVKQKLESKFDCEEMSSVDLLKSFSGFTLD